jgi:hypothetical protein
MLLRGKCKGNAQIYAEARRKMHLKALGDLFSKLTEWRIRFEKSPNKSKDPMGTFPTGSLANRKQEDPLGLLPRVSPHI